MTAFLWIILLALAWTAVNGRFDPTEFVVGLALAGIIMLFVRASGADYAGKARALVALAIYFVVELFLANLRMARDVLAPRQRFSPGVVAIPLDLREPGHVTALANILTLTPGTLSLDISEDRTVLYIHDMYARDPEAVRRGVKDGFERRLKELFE